MDEKYNSWKRAQDVQIDLIGLLLHICMDWKRAVICALVPAVIFLGYGIHKSTGGRQRQETGVAQQAGLTQEEQQAVTAAVEQEAEAKRLENYLSSSVLMQADPYHKNVAVLLFAVSNAKRQEVNRITESYISFLTNGSAIDRLLKSGGGDWEMDKSCLAELVRAYQKPNTAAYQIAVDSTQAGNLMAESLFCVELTAKDESMAKRLAEDVQSALRKHSGTVGDAAGRHKLTLISSGQSQVPDSSLQALQHENRALLSAGLSNLKAMTDAFSQEQANAYAKAVGAEGMGGIDGNQDTQGNEKSLAAGTFGICLKYMLAGFFAGAVIYCFVSACVYLFRDTVSSVREMKERYTFPVYGSISIQDKAGSVRRGKDGCQSEGVICSRVRLACKKRGIKKLCAASGFALGKEEKQRLEDMAAQLRSFGIEMQIAGNSISDAGIWEMLEESGNVLFICRIGETTHRMVDEAMEFYEESGIAVIGAMAYL